MVGVIFGLNALGITDINVFFDGWWTLFIIIPSIIEIIKEPTKQSGLSCKKYQNKTNTFEESVRKRYAQRIERLKCLSLLDSF